MSCSFKNLIRSQIDQCDYGLLDSIGIVHALERPLGGFEVGVELFDESSVWGCQDSIHDTAHKILKAVEKLIKIDERTLCFNMSVFCQVPSCFRLLSTI